MKLLVVGDVHLSQYSSIVRSRGQYYSARLENCIRSIIWAEETAIQRQCDRIIYLGDLFDKAVLQAEELAALQEIEWAPIPHILLVGNHECATRDLVYSTAHIMHLLPNFRVIDTPTMDFGFGWQCLYLPYIFEQDRQPLHHYLDTTTRGIATTQEVKQLFIFSHNDIKGIQYGQFESKEGFELSDIEKYHCHFINGHIHNGSYVDKQQHVINLGNLTGQNFNEDAAQYPHHVLYLDYENHVVCTEFIENPFAYNFYKVDASDVKGVQRLLDSLKDHAIVCLKCPESIAQDARNMLAASDKIEECRVIVEVDSAQKVDDTEYTAINDVDYIKQFKDFIVEKVGPSEALLKELQQL